MLKYLREQNLETRAIMLSAHADRDELLRWAGSLKSAPKQTFVIHGEPTAADTLRHSLEEKLGWACQVPDHLQQVTLS